MVICVEPELVLPIVRLFAASVKVPDGVTLPTSTAKVLDDDRW